MKLGRSDLALSAFSNPIWQALQTRHRRFARCAGSACRYPAEVAPFAAVATPTVSALRDLSTLLAPAESVWMMSQNEARVPELDVAASLECLQMVLTPKLPRSSSAPEVVKLSNADAPAMQALTDLAFPGYFRKRTCEMGSYFGVRCNDELIAMGGERLSFDEFAEISAVCTHPAHRGRGLAAGIIGKLTQLHRTEGLVSWLHVGADNARAIELYLTLGFEVLRAVTLDRLVRLH
jgi:predicted GNAT family acetyltransferase